MKEKEQTIQTLQKEVDTKTIENKRNEEIIHNLNEENQEHQQRIQQLKQEKEDIIKERNEKENEIHTLNKKM